LATSKINDLHAIRVSHFYFVGLCRCCVGIFRRWIGDRSFFARVYCDGIVIG
jgi:hypothetical protein